MLNSFILHVHILEMPPIQAFCLFVSLSFCQRFFPCFTSLVPHRFVTRPWRTRVSGVVHPCFQCLGLYFAQSRHAGWLKLWVSCTDAMLSWDFKFRDTLHWGSWRWNWETEGLRSSPSPPVHLCFPMWLQFLLPLLPKLLATVTLDMFPCEPQYSHASLPLGSQFLRDKPG